MLHLLITLYQHFQLYNFKNLYTIAELVAPAIIFSNFLNLIFERIFLPKQGIFFITFFNFLLFAFHWDSCIKLQQISFCTKE